MCNNTATKSTRRTLKAPRQACRNVYRNAAAAAKTRLADNVAATSVESSSRESASAARDRTVGASPPRGSGGVRGESGREASTAIPAEVAIVAIVAIVAARAPVVARAWDMG